MYVLMIFVFLKKVLNNSSSFAKKIYYLSYILNNDLN